MLSFALRECIQTHTGLNYGFDLNAHTTLDSARLGNDTRYLNDARPTGEPGEQENNCDARSMWHVFLYVLWSAHCVSLVRLVNGDHRIAFVTRKHCNNSLHIFRVGRLVTKRHYSESSGGKRGAFPRLWTQILDTWQLSEGGRNKTKPMYWPGHEFDELCVMVGM